MSEEARSFGNPNVVFSNTAALVRPGEFSRFGRIGDDSGSHLRPASYAILCGR